MELFFLRLNSTRRRGCRSVTSVVNAEGMYTAWRRERFQGPLLRYEVDQRVKRTLIFEHDHPVANQEGGLYVYIEP